MDFGHVGHSRRGAKRACAEQGRGAPPGPRQQGAGTTWEIRCESEEGWGVGPQRVFSAGRAVPGLLFGWGDLVAERKISWGQDLRAGGLGRRPDTAGGSPLACAGGSGAPGPEPCSQVQQDLWPGKEGTGERG